MYLLIFAGLFVYKFRKKGLFLGGQNVISWGHKGGLGGHLPPPAYMLKNALASGPYDELHTHQSISDRPLSH
jgi:hypothetical protein